MIPKIRSIRPLDNFQLLVTFDGGVVVNYDVLDDINTIREFKSLQTEYGLFQNVQIDSSRTCIYWNDRIDISSDTILEYGRPVSDK